MRRRPIGSLAILFLLAVPPRPVRAQVEVGPTVETTAVTSRGDAADDACFWIHSTDASLSTIIGTDKRAGLHVYDLNGQQLQFVSGRRMNNVDVRYNFPLAGERISLVCASDKTRDSIAIFKVNPSTRLLQEVTGTPVDTREEAYGGAMYLSPMTGKYYFFHVTRGDAFLQQWELFDNGAGGVDATLVRNLPLPDHSEGVVADDELAFLYLAVEDEELRKYGAEPEDGDSYIVVDTAGRNGHIHSDIEGLAIYYASDRTGYLLASSQGDDQFVIYSREGSNDYIMTFEIIAQAGIDEVTHTDGIDVTNFPLGSTFPKGAFVAQDDSNETNQNFKLVPWEAIATAVEPQLKIDLQFDPRRLGGEVARFVRGDCNSDGSIDVADPLALLVGLFQLSLGHSWECADACDVDDDGKHRLDDAIESIVRIWGPLAPAPRTCSADRTDDDLGCLVPTCP